MNWTPSQKRICSLARQRCFTGNFRTEMDGTPMAGNGKHTTEQKMVMTGGWFMIVYDDRNGGFHSHGATPIAGWFKRWKILLKLG